MQHFPGGKLFFTVSLDPDADLPTDGVSLRPESRRLPGYYQQSSANRHFFEIQTRLGHADYVEEPTAILMQRFMLVVASVLVPVISWAEETHPNVVLIVSDDQGHNDPGCIRGGDIITPHLDRLAEEGTRLTSFFVTWPACTPGRGGFLTGRYPQRNGIYDMIRNKAPDYGHLYKPGEYDATFERTEGMRHPQDFTLLETPGTGPVLRNMRRRCHRS
ncbi:MAG: sulfatase-like hydrolase/transferase [Fuerstiella sp.]